MNVLLDDSREVLAAFLKAQVDFTLIGGYAVILHGYGRTTGDMDLFLRPDNANKLRFIEGLRIARIDDGYFEAIRATDFTEPTVFSVGSEPDKIDFLTRISGVTYEEADSEKVVVDVE